MLTNTVELIELLCFLFISIMLWAVCNTATRYNLNYLEKSVNLMMARKWPPWQLRLRFDRRATSVRRTTVTRMPCDPVLVASQLQPLRWAKFQVGRRRLNRPNYVFHSRVLPVYTCVISVTLKLYDSLTMSIRKYVLAGWLIGYVWICFTVDCQRLFCFQNLVQFTNCSDVVFASNKWYKIGGFEVVLRFVSAVFSG